MKKMLGIVGAMLIAGAVMAGNLNVTIENQSKKDQCALVTLRILDNSSFGKMIWVKSERVDIAGNSYGKSSINVPDMNALDCRGYKAIVGILCGPQGACATERQYQDCNMDVNYTKNCSVINCPDEVNFIIPKNIFEDDDIKNADIHCNGINEFQFKI